MLQVKSRHLIIFLIMMNSLLVLLCLGAEKIHKRQSGDFQRNYTFLEKIVPTTYMEDWADSILSDLFTVSSRTLDRKYARSVEYFSKNTDFSEIFKEITNLLKNKDASTAFFPETFSVDKKNKQVQVTGRFLIHDAKLKKMIEETKTFVLVWQVLPNGRTVIHSIRQEKGGTNNE